MQAAVGVAQAEKLDEFVKARRGIAEAYKSLLQDTKGVVLSPEMPWAKNVYWMHPILIEDKFGISKDELVERMDKMGIETRPIFYPISSMPPYNEGNSFPVAEELSKKGICLPCWVNLSKQDIELIAKVIRGEVG